MVAITVILASVTAGFVLGLRGEQAVAPTANFNFEYDASTDAVIVTHAGGDFVKQEELFVRGDDLGESGNWASLTGSQATGSSEGVTAVVPGDSARVTGVSSDYVLRVIWKSDTGGMSAVLAVNEGPEV